MSLREKHGLIKGIFKDSSRQTKSLPPSPRLRTKSTSPEISLQKPNFSPKVTEDVKYDYFRDRHVFVKLCHAIENWPGSLYKSHSENFGDLKNFLALQFGPYFQDEIRQIENLKLNECKRMIMQLGRIEIREKFKTNLDITYHIKGSEQQENIDLNSLQWHRNGGKILLEILNFDSKSTLIIKLSRQKKKKIYFCRIPLANLKQGILQEVLIHDETLSKNVGTLEFTAEIKNSEKKFIHEIVQEKLESKLKQTLRSLFSFSADEFQGLESDTKLLSKPQDIFLVLRNKEKTSELGSKAKKKINDFFSLTASVSSDNELELGLWIDNNFGDAGSNQVVSLMEIDLVHGHNLQGDKTKLEIRAERNLFRLSEFICNLMIHPESNLTWDLETKYLALIKIFSVFNAENDWTESYLLALILLSKKGVDVPWDILETALEKWEYQTRYGRNYSSQAINNYVILFLIQLQNLLHQKFPSKNFEQVLIWLRNFANHLNDHFVLDKIRQVARTSLLQIFDQSTSLESHFNIVQNYSLELCQELIVSLDKKFKTIFAVSLSSLISEISLNVGFSLLKIHLKEGNEDLETKSFIAFYRYRKLFSYLQADPVQDFIKGLTNEEYYGPSLTHLEREFEIYLPMWAQTAIIKAQSQVQVVNRFEQEIAEQLLTMEGAQNVNQILKSCVIFWQDIDWPDSEKSMEFITYLLINCNEIYNHYIDRKYEFMQLDNFFNELELADILSSLFCSAKFLDSFESAVVKKFKKEDAVEFQDIIDEYKGRVFNRSFFLMKSFLDGQRRIISKLITQQNFQELCEFLPRVLQSIVRELNLESEATTGRFMGMLECQLYQIACTELRKETFRIHLDNFHKKGMNLDIKEMYECVQRLHRKLTESDSSSRSTLLEEGLEALEELTEDMDRSLSSTKDLIMKCMQNLVKNQKLLSKQQTYYPHLSLSYSKDSETLSVTLNSLLQVEEFKWFRVDMHLVNNEKSRVKSKIYQDQPNLLFNLRSSPEYQFKMPISYLDDCDEDYLFITLNTFSFTKAGFATKRPVGICVVHIIQVTEPVDVKNLPLSLDIIDVEHKDFIELRMRSCDKKAQQFVNKLEQAKAKLAVTIRTKSQDFAAQSDGSSEEI